MKKKIKKILKKYSIEAKYLGKENNIFSFQILSPIKIEEVLTDITKIQKVKSANFLMTYSKTEGSMFLKVEKENSLNFLEGLDCEVIAQEGNEILLYAPNTEAVHDRISERLERAVIQSNYEDCTIKVSL